METSKRKLTNTQRLALIDKSIRARVAAVIADLEAAGLSPVIHSDVHRTPEKQLELLRKGKTQVRWGFHNAMTADNKPGALAADIIDAALAWNAPASFWLALGAAAKKHGLHWGGYFGLPQGLKNKLYAALGTPAADPRMKLGWDCSHIEVAGITIAEARKGKR